MANTLINTPDLLDLGSATGATILPKGGTADRPPIPTLSVDYLVVAGGGGGGTGVTASTIGTGGGGGAGGLRTSYNNSTTTTNSLNFPAGKTAIATYMLDNNATDVSGNYNGTASNISYNTGKYGGGAVFNGSSSYISANDPNSGGGARSFSAWIKTTSTGFQSIITNGGASYTSGLNMFVYNNKLYSTSGNGSGENYGPTSSADVNTGAWVHCVLTMSGTAIGSTLKTYVNGTLDGTHTTTVAITDTYNAFRIGARYINGSYAAAWFDGEIDQVRIYNVALSATDVSNIYTNEVQADSGGGSAAESSLSLLMATNYTVTIGDGGNGGTSGSSGATNGQDSVFSSITSVGGGAAGSYRNPTSSIYFAQIGGSGGGSTYRGASGTTGADGTANQGYKGGNDLGNGGASAYGPGGGGGASAAGVNGDGTAPGGGGDGLAVAITGSSVTYAGGGGAGGLQGYTQAVGGAGGGGAGGVGNGNAGTAGTANTGGGGGGGGKTTASGTLPGSGAAGGSGIVILRYASTTSVTVGSGLSTSILNGTVSGSTDKYTIFTSGTGTITFATSASNPNSAVDGVFRFNTDTNKTEFYNGNDWEEVTDQYASGYDGIPSNFFDTKLYTGNGSTQSIGGYINGAGSFNGSSSIISVPDLKSVLNNNFSVSFWWKPELMNTFQVPIGGLYDETGGAAYGWMVYQGSDNKMYLYWIISISPNTSNAFSNNTVLTQGSWYHIVATKSSTGAALYVNKADAASSPSAGSVWNIEYTTNPNFYFGKRNVSNNYANGILDQVRLYDTILTQTNVDDLYDETATTATTAAYPSGQTAVATYTMDTSANGLLTTTDLSTVNYPAGAGCIALYEMNGNSNDTSGTYNGTPTDITYQEGTFDQAAVFNGSSSVIILPQSTVFDLNGAGSFSLWVNRNDTTRRWIFEKANGGSGSYGWQMEFGGTDYRFQMHDTSDNVITAVTGTSGLAINTWEHIVVTSSASKTYKIYFNGNLRDTQTLSGTVSVNTNGARLGEYSLAAGYSFSGEMDQVRFFNTELTQSQVTTLARGIATSYSGTSTDVNFNGYLNFQPGLTWVKARDAAHDHVLVDSVNGAGSNKGLSSNATYYEGEYTATYGYISSLNSNGFTVAAGSSYANYTNVNNEDYVSWNWKGGGPAVTNNDGTISSQVSANKDSGFSIVKYAGNSTSGATVGHGLSDIPEIIIFKSTNTGGSNWITTITEVSSNQYLYLNNQGIGGTGGFAVDATNITLDNTYGDANTSGRDYIAYCWRSVAGFSKIGTFAGTGTTPGNVVTVGFEPRFLLVKSTTYAGTNWIILDKARTPNNPMENDLNPNLANAEQTGTGNNYPQATTTSTTFQCNTTDSSINRAGETYIYLAIA